VLRVGPGMRLLWTNAIAVSLVLAAATVVVAKNVDRQAGGGQLVNVSYDPTRELYRDLNATFNAGYRARTGRTLTIAQSHGGSSRQAKAVADGLDADVVTLALHSDVDLLRKRGLVAEGWSNRLPHRSSPYTSTIVFVVRRGNPYGIHDWPDLVRSKLSIVTPSPKTSGNGKLALLAAWGSVIRRGGDEAAARTFVSEIEHRVVELDPGARAATLAFSEEKVGDVHLTWESEALREVADSAGELALVYPPVSILAEPCVAWVDANVERRGTRDLAREYLEFLFTDEGQEILAQHGFRPYREDIGRRHLDGLPVLDLFPITLVAKDWEDAQAKFFSEGGVLDTIDQASAK
jgi:sulfate/thiosulfate transport system substrate-binding protein